ncbi:MAG: RnfH family protein [Proteobacteria bacterium]|nr:RnfH family protein [Pseudomonadota bacterium]
MQVTVALALPDRAWLVALRLPAGATVDEAVERSGLRARAPGVDQANLTLAIFGKPITPATVLRDGDRVELLRPLLLDPKQARRRRAREG